MKTLLMVGAALVVLAGPASADSRSGGYGFCHGPGCGDRDHGPGRHGGGGSGGGDRDGRGASFVFERPGSGRVEIRCADGDTTQECIDAILPLLQQMIAHDQVGGTGAQGLGPNGMGPNGMGPNGMGPSGMGQNGMGSPGGQYDGSGDGWQMPAPGDDGMMPQGGPDDGGSPEDGAQIQLTPAPPDGPPPLPGPDGPDAGQGPAE